MLDVFKVNNPKSYLQLASTAQKMKFSIKAFFGKYGQNAVSCGFGHIY